jgi:hypothetical protein
MVHRITEWKIFFNLCHGYSTSSVQSKGTGSKGVHARQNNLRNSSTNKLCTSFPLPCILRTYFLAPQRGPSSAENAENFKTKNLMPSLPTLRPVVDLQSAGTQSNFKNAPQKTGSTNTPLHQIPVPQLVPGAIKW